MKTFKNLTMVGILLNSGCTTTQKSIVLERADDLSSRPEWASTVNSHLEKDGKYFYIGYVEVPGDSSKSAALNMSDEKSMSEPFRALADQFLDQNQVGEELRKDDVIGQRIISATRGYRPPMPTLHIVNRYWETVKIPNENNPDESKIEVRAFSMAEITKADFQHAKNQYLAKLKGNSEVKEILKEVGAEQRQASMAH